MADPARTAERLTALPWLLQRLDAYPDPRESIPVATEEGTPAPWLAWDALLCLKVASAAENPLYVRERYARRAVKALAKLPESLEASDLGRRSLPETDSGWCHLADSSGLSLLAAALERLPPVVAAVARPDPLLPVVCVSGEPRERTRGRLAFGGLREAGDPTPAQLPLIPAPPGPTVPMLDVANLSGVPPISQGRGAPLPMRLLVAAAKAVPHRARGYRSQLTVTVRELVSFCFPSGWQRGRDWPRLQAALMQAHTFQIPGRFEFRPGDSSAAGCRSGSGEARETARNWMIMCSSTWSFRPARETDPR